MGHGKKSRMLSSVAQPFFVVVVVASRRHDEQQKKNVMCAG